MDADAQQKIEKLGKIKKIKNFEKNCWEVVWPPLALCRGGVGASPTAFAGPYSADFPGQYFAFCWDSQSGKTAVKRTATTVWPFWRRARREKGRARFKRRQGEGLAACGQMAASVRAWRAGKLRREVVKKRENEKTPCILNEVFILFF